MSFNFKRLLYWCVCAMAAALAGIMFVELFLATAVAQDNISVDAFAKQVIEAIAGFGGMPWVVKVSIICALLVSSMKVTFLVPLWDKLGGYKNFAGLTLGLIAGAFYYFGSEGANAGGFVAYVFAGSGASIVAGWLDGLKELPFIGSTLKVVINAIAGFLGGRKSE